MKWYTYKIISDTGTSHFTPWGPANIWDTPAIAKENLDSYLQQQMRKGKLESIEIDTERLVRTFAWGTRTEYKLVEHTGSDDWTDDWFKENT